jgi:hypothetical protein
MYGRNHPLGYADPSGEVIELSGDDASEIRSWRLFVGSLARRQDRIYTITVFQTKTEL